MSNTTIIELRQADSNYGLIPLANGGNQNGVWRTTLDTPVIIEEGDQVQIKSVYLDTSASGSGYIQIEQPVDITMTACMYLTNYNLDQSYHYTTQYNPAPEDNELRKYGNTDPPRTLDNVGDNNRWILAKQTVLDGDHYNVPQFNIQPINPSSETREYGGATLVFEYTGTEKNAIPYGQKKGIYVDATFEYKYKRRNPYNLGIRCKGDATAPFIRLSAETQSALYGLNIASINYPIKELIPSATKINTIQEFPLKFTIDAGQYSPTEMADLITAKMNDVEFNGNVNDNYIDAGSTEAGGERLNNMVNYPVNAPFLTTVLQNEQKLKAEGVASGDTLDQVFVNATGYSKASSLTDTAIKNRNGNYWFKYNIQQMLKERKVFTSPGPSTSYTQPSLDVFIGTNQLEMAYDEGSAKLKFAIQHFPIYANDTFTNPVMPATPVSNNDAKPSVCFNPTSSDGDFHVNTGLPLAYSGIAWTNLEPPNFWNNILGFTTAHQGANTNQGFMPDTGGAAVPDIANSFELELVDGINITSAFPGLDLPVVKQGARFNIPLYEAPPIAPALVGAQTFVSTDDTTSIYSARTWNTALADEGYFLVDVACNFQQNLVGQSITTSNTQSIVNRYYSANSFTSDQGAGSIVYTHQGEPTMLSNFSVQVRNPDRSFIDSHILQNDNTIFVEVVKNQSTNSIRN